MKIIPFYPEAQEQTDIAQTVYESLLGLLVPGCRLDWVEDIFVPGHPCHESYRQMNQAYSRLLDRLDEVDEDPDAEQMVMHLLDYSHIIALEMFKYGQKYQKMMDSES